MDEEQEVRHEGASHIQEADEKGWPTVARCGREAGTSGELWRLPAGHGGGMRAEEEAGVSDKWH